MEKIGCYLKCNKCGFINPVLCGIDLLKLSKLLKNYKCLSCGEHKEVVVLPENFDEKGKE